MNWHLSPLSRIFTVTHTLVNDLFESVASPQKGSLLSILGENVVSVLEACS
jgi:hypothetical protein